MAVKSGKLNVKNGGRGQKMVDAQDVALRLALSVSEDQEDKLKARQAARKSKSKDSTKDPRVDSSGKNKKPGSRKPRLERMKEVIQAKQTQKKKLKSQHRKSVPNIPETDDAEPASQRKVAFA